MKKLIGIVALVMVLVGIMTACGQFQCDLCSLEKSGKSYQYETGGETAILCEECYEEMKKLEELQDVLD